MSAGYREWLSHRLRLRWSSTAIQQCDNQISANKSWFAAQLKSGSSCFWKGLFDNVIELYQQEIVHGNINNHKSNYFLISDPPPADAGSFRMGRKKKEVTWCRPLRAPPRSRLSAPRDRSHRNHQALSAESNANIHSKGCGTQTSEQQQRAGCDVLSIKRPHFLSDSGVGLVA